jgi:hypothetical protein
VTSGAVHFHAAIITANRSTVPHVILGCVPTQLLSSAILRLQNAKACIQISACDVQDAEEEEFGRLERQIRLEVGESFSGILSVEVSSVPYFFVRGRQLPMLLCRLEKFTQ